MQDTNTTEYTRDEQEALYAQWKISGESQAAFCRDQNIPYNKFSYWRKRKEAKKSKKAPLFAHAKLLNPAARNSSPVGRLILPNGMRAEIFSEPVLFSLIKEMALAI